MGGETDNRKKKSAYVSLYFLIIIQYKMIKHYLTVSPSFSAAISEVSGGTAAPTTCGLLLLTLFRLSDSTGDHQRETWRPVSHRHSETQETAVRTPPTMTITNDHSTLPSRRWMPLALPPRPHPINTSHGKQ